MVFSSLVTALLMSAPADSVPKAFSVLPLPLIYYTPETRLAYGVAATATFRFRRDMHVLRADSSGQAGATVRPSQITLGFAYTQNKQILFYLPFQLFYDQDKYYINGEAGYYRYTYFFYGVGQQEVTRELYAVDFPRIRINAFRRIVPKSGAESCMPASGISMKIIRSQQLNPVACWPRERFPAGQAAGCPEQGLVYSMTRVTRFSFHPKALWLIFPILFIVRY